MAAAKASNAKSTGGGAEKRQTRRRPILETFSLFVVVPKKGPYRLAVHDASEHGLGFTVDLEDEPRDAFPLANGDRLEIQLYLNRSLYIPLSVELMRVDGSGNARRVGSRFTDQKSAAYGAYASFLNMLDAIIEVARVE